ncbi:MAG: hypothetical protein ACJ8CR_07380 [Roseiflexaceae bacterium]
MFKTDQQMRRQSAALEPTHQQTWGKGSDAFGKVLAVSFVEANFTPERGVAGVIRHRSGGLPGLTANDRQDILSPKEAAEAALESQGAMRRCSFPPLPLKRRGFQLARDR